MGLTVANGYDAGEFHRKDKSQVKLWLLILTVRSRLCGWSVVLVLMSTWGGYARALDAAQGASPLGDVSAARDTRDAHARALGAAPASASRTPSELAERGAANPLVGLWTTHDDETQSPMALVRLSVEAGRLHGRIEKILDPLVKPHERCAACPGERHNASLVGLEIIRTGAWDEQRRQWSDAFILDPENGQEYRLGLTLMNGAQSLQVRGFWGIFWRNQVWTRSPTP